MSTAERSAASCKSWQRAAADASVNRLRAGDDCPGTSDDHLMRAVLDAVLDAVDALAQAAVGAETGQDPAAAWHLEALGQSIAGITIDALLTWPSRDRLGG